MIEVSSQTIDKSCKLTRNYFPSSLIIKIFKEIIDDETLNEFPEIRSSEAKIFKSKKSRGKLSTKAIEEMSTYFYENPDNFLIFLKTLSSQSIQNQIVNKIILDEFISKVNTLLLKDANIKIENYELIQKWIPNKARKDVFLNINVPEYIQDYFSEALNCLSYGLHRSAILFCTFALEASLRYKYFEMLGTTKIQSKNGKTREITFNELIDWAIKEGLIEVIYAETENLNFIRKYRNDLVHCDLTKPDKASKISADYARKMANIVVLLVERFINEVFYEETYMMI